MTGDDSLIDARIRQVLFERAISRFVAALEQILSEENVQECAIFHVASSNNR